MQFLKKLLQNLSLQKSADGIGQVTNLISGVTGVPLPGYRDKLGGIANKREAARQSLPNYTGTRQPAKLPQGINILGDSRGNQNSFNDILEQGQRNATPVYGLPSRGIPRMPSTSFQYRQPAPTIDELRRRYQQNQGSFQGDPAMLGYGEDLTARRY